MKQSHVKKAVIPCAGKGTRFLPASKETPKEMLSVLNKPMIHYVVEEAVKAGIEKIAFITSSGKSTIEDYFDRNLELEKFLTDNKKDELLKEVQEVGDMVELTSIRQKQQLGLGHAVLMAKDFVGGDDFVVLVPDEIIDAPVSCTKQLIDARERLSLSSSHMIGVMEVPREKTSSYGIVKLDPNNLVDEEGTDCFTEMIEKPKPAQAPSLLATPGRYVFNSEIFKALESIPRGRGGEYQLTDAINLLAKNGNCFCHQFNGQRFDTGSVEGYLEANLYFALQSDEYKDVTKSMIAKYADFN